MEFSSLPEFLTVLGIACLVLAAGLWLTARHANRRKPEPCCDGHGWICGDRGWRFVCEKHETRTAGVVGLEDPTPDEVPMFVGDFSGMEALPEALYEPQPSLREEQIAVPREAS